MSTMKLQRCEHCSGTGRPYGIMGDLCTYCRGSGHIPTLQSVPAPSSPSPDLIERLTKINQDLSRFPGYHGAIQAACDWTTEAAAELSRLRAALTKIASHSTTSGMHDQNRAEKLRLIAVAALGGQHGQ